MKPIFGTLSVLVLLLGPSSAVIAHDRDDNPPAHTRDDLRELAAQITGGASLLVDVASSRRTQAFRDRAHQFEGAVERRNDLGDDWREVRSSFEAARQSARRRDDPRIIFLVSHLEDDLAEADPLVASYASASAPPPSGGTVDSSGRISFIDQETCVGTGSSGRNVSIRAGVQLESPSFKSAKLQLLGEYYDGNSPNGQFFERTIRYVGFGAHVYF